MRISVDLPEPLAPMRPNISPRATSNETSCTARTRRRGRRRRRGPTPGVNVLDTRRTTSGSSEGKGDMAVLAARERTEHAPGGIKHADGGVVSGRLEDCGYEGAGSAGAVRLKRSPP